MAVSRNSVFVGTAAWGIPHAYRGVFPLEGSLLERYSRVLSGVEINTSFYRDHMESTYEKWSAVTPAPFRFSVKLSRELTHDLRLECSAEEIAAKLKPIMALKEKLGVILVQLPPSLPFDRATAVEFFANLREITDVPIAFEPRHPSWVSSPAKKILSTYAISKVMADPDPCETADWEDFLNGGLVYHRLHGSPVRFRTLYRKPFIDRLTEMIRSQKRSNTSIWCIFDNTAYGFATYNAMEVMKKLKPQSHLVLPEPFLEARSN